MLNDESTDVSEHYNTQINEWKIYSKNKTLIYIYQITSKLKNNNENYIGQTDNFKNRKECHRRDSGTSDLKVYKIIRKHGGWKNWNIKILNYYYCNNENEARQIEQKYIDTYKSTMNSIRAYSLNKNINKKLDKELEYELNYEINVLNCNIFGYFLYDFYDDFENSENMACQYCNKIYSNIYYLNNHQKITKKCLEIQRSHNTNMSTIELEYNRIVTTQKKDIEEQNETIKINNELNNKSIDDSEYKCSFCNKVFSNKYTLQNHIEKAKYCIKLRNKNKNEHKCNFCQKKFVSKYSLKSHTNICETKKEIEKENLEFKEIEILKHKVFKLEKQIENYQIQIKKLQEQNEKLIIAAINRPIYIS